MKSIADIEAIRVKTLAEINLRVNKEGFKIVVGMGTSGIAAGARNVMNTLITELKKNGVTNANIVISGVNHGGFAEPYIEVNHGTEKVTYVKLDDAKAIKIVNEHIVGGKVVAEFKA